jgi:hypothetical protein
MRASTVLGEGHPGGVALPTVGAAGLAAAAARAATTGREAGKMQRTVTELERGTLSRVDPGTPGCATGYSGT